MGVASAAAPTSALLPPSASPNKKTLILDLDHTLIYATRKPSKGRRYDFRVKIYTRQGLLETYYILKRPGVDILLEKISKDFEIVVFTSGTELYASQILDRMDPRRLISHRLYRDSCKEIRGKIFKDLTDLGRGMGQVLAVDDHPELYLFESLPPWNVFPVPGFEGKLPDQQLKRVLKFLQSAASSNDTREAIRQHYDTERNTRLRKLKRCRSCEWP